MAFAPAHHRDREQATFRNSLMVALVLSVLVHVTAYGAYQWIKRMQWTGYDRILRLLTPKPSQWTPAVLDFFRPKPKAPPNPAAQLLPREIQVVIEPEPPMSFLAVDPMQATADAPDKPKFYSDKNSLAANREIKKESQEPNVDGQRTLVPFTLDVPRQTQKPEPVQAPQPRPSDKKAAEEKAPESKAEPLQPQAPQKAADEVQPKPKGGDVPGDLAMAKPLNRQVTSDGNAETEKGQSDKFFEKKGEQPEAKTARPRTLIEARARMQDNMISGEKMRQEGGVKHKLEFSALDAKATPFGAYDNAIVAAIQQCWYDLLTQSKFSSDANGKVVLEFRLHVNGSISHMKVTEATVNEFLSLLCQTAVTKPSPYPKWPPEMQRTFSGEYREVRFTFFYY